MTQKHYEARYVTTATDGEWIAFQLELAKNHAQVIVYHHEKGSVHGFITSMHPSSFLIHFAQDPEESVLDIEEIKVYKSELIFLKKMVKTALDLWKE